MELLEEDNYLGLAIWQDLKWKSHANDICTKDTAILFRQNRPVNILNSSFNISK